MYAGAPKHPIFSGSTFGLMSGEKPLFQPQVNTGHEGLGQALHQMGLHFEETSGKYKEPERSYIIHGATVDQMKHLAKMFGQESVVHSQNGQHRLIYTNGPHEGKFHAAQMQTPVEHFEQPPQDFYTAVPGHGYMRINFDWNQMQDMEHGHKKAEREFDLDTAMHLAKNAVAQLLTAQAPVKAHPHSYDWHDGHTDHHQEDLGGPQLPGLAKAGEAHPHMDTPPMQPAPHPTNDQAAGVGVSTYKKFALPFGNVQPGQPQDLLHYKYHGKLPQIEKLVADHGFKAYYAGGKYGKPDLANKNYNTGHLMVYDPTPDSGANFGHEEYTRGWRQIHELAHATTYPELNKIYGEGRRMGKLGVHRTLNEALRAVHWEWLAAHKQRELSKQVGVNISDQDFNKELNTVMHDAAHRAVTGKFTEPSGEGFIPHGHHVPLHVSLQMVRDAAHEMGLKGMHETIKKDPMQKNLPLKSPAAAGVTRAPAAQPAAPAAAAGPVDHVGNFMTQLKGMRGDNVARGKHITQAMSNPDFIGALQTHPQGKQIHAMLTNHLNSTANAGPKAPMKVTAKSEELDKGGGHGRESKTKPPAPPDPRKRTNFDRKPHNGSSRDRNLDPDDRVANSWANSVMPGYQKSEPNLSKAEGDHPVAEKTYTAEEANEILLKATREKLTAFAQEIQVLRERELKKALIPPHKHNQASQASMAAEDIPPGKLNPKGVDKALDKNAAMGYGQPATMSAAPGAGASLAMAEQDGEMCKACKSMKKMCKCMGKSGQEGTKIPPPTGGAEGAHADAQAEMAAKQVKKADLVSENGKRTDNHTAPGTKEIPKGTKEIERGSKKDPGSGGIKLPGSKLKKNAAPPMAKPPSGKNMGTAVPTSAPKPPAMKAEPIAKFAPSPGLAPAAAPKPAAPAGPKFGSQPGAPGLPPGAGFGASGHVITQAIPKPKLPGAGLKPAAPTGRSDATVAMKPPAMGKNDLDVEKAVDKIVVHGDKPSSPPKGADYTSSKQGDKAVYEAKKPEDLNKVGLPATKPAGPSMTNQMMGAGAPSAGHAQRAAGFQAAAGGAFQPKGPISSGLELAPKGGAKLPGVGVTPKPAAPLGLASPKAAGATRAPGAPPNPAAAKPAGAKPGIFGKLFGGK